MRLVVYNYPGVQGVQPILLTLLKAALNGAHSNGA